MNTIPDYNIIVVHNDDILREMFHQGAIDTKTNITETSMVRYIAHAKLLLRHLNPQNIVQAVTLLLNPPSDNTPAPRLTRFSYEDMTIPPALYNFCRQLEKAKALSAYAQYSECLALLKLSEYFESEIPKRIAAQPPREPGNPAEKAVGELKKELACAISRTTREGLERVRTEDPVVYVSLIICIYA